MEAIIGHRLSLHEPLLLLLLLMNVLPLASTQDVRMPPSLTIGPVTQMYYKERASVTLSCEGLGHPSPSYEWTKNGVPLNVNSGNIIMRPGVGTIDISVCLSTDDGYYQCIISNSYGRTMSNVTFLQMASLASFPPNNGPFSYSVDLNGYQCLPCQPPLASIPAADIYWKYNYTGNTGKPVDVVQNPRIQTDPFTGSLCLTKIESLDGTADRNKVYICHVENTVIQTVNQGSYSMLTTTTNSMGTYGPVFTFGTATTVIGLEGETMVLRSFFSGNPVPSITWKKNGQPYPQNRWTVTHSCTGLTLISGQLTQDDAGQYTSEASNGIGTTLVYTMQLNIQARPVFVSSDGQPHDVNVTETGTVSISCSPRAIPEVTIRWFKNQVEFTAASLPPKMSLSADLKTLTISDVCKNCYDGSSGDLMVVQCNASNEHGYSFAQGYVNVLIATTITNQGGNRPWIPFQNEVFDVIATTDDSTTLTYHWTFNGLTIQETEKIFVASNGSLVILTQNDTDGGESRLGEYLCVASNGFSHSEILYVYGYGGQTGCEPNPCLNDGTCAPVTGGGFSCDCSILYTGTRCESQNYQVSCGDLTWTQYPPKNGFSIFCYYWVPLSDTEGRFTACQDTLQNLPVWGNYNNLLTSGGNFGCVIGQDYPDDNHRTSTVACADDYQHDVSLGASANDQARIMICIRYPYEGIPPA